MRMLQQATIGKWIVNLFDLEDKTYEVHRYRRCHEGELSFHYRIAFFDDYQEAFKEYLRVVEHTLTFKGTHVENDW